MFAYGSQERKGKSRKKTVYVYSSEIFSAVSIRAVCLGVSGKRASTVIVSISFIWDSSP